MTISVAGPGLIRIPLMPMLEGKSMLRFSALVAAAFALAIFVSGACASSDRLGSEKAAW